MTKQNKNTEKQCDIHVVGTRTFRMSGMHNGEKFVKEIKANDSESAIAYFELTFTNLTWRFITDVT